MVPVRRHARYWRAYLACGGLVLACFLTKPRPRQVQAEEQASRKAGDTNDSQKKKPPGYEYKDYDHSSEGEHRTTEQFAWRNQQSMAKWTLISAVVAAALSAGTVIFTANQAHIAQQSLIDSNRAWLDVSVDAKTATLTWIKDIGPVFTGDFTGENKGNSPALNAQVFPILFIRDQIAGAKTYKNSLNCGESGGYGNIAFVRDRFHPNSSASITKKSIDDYVAQVSINNTKSRISTVTVPMSVLICGTYSIAGESAGHHTSRIYDIGVRSPVNPKLADSEVRLNEDIAAGSMFMLRRVAGEVAD